MNPYSVAIYVTWLVRPGKYVDDVVLIYMLSPEGRMNILRMIPESEIDAWENEATLESLGDE